MQQIDRTALRLKAMGLIWGSRWSRVQASAVIGVSTATLRRMEENGDRWERMSSATVERLAAGVTAALGQQPANASAPQTVAVEAEIVTTATEQEEASLIPAARHTGMTTVRTVNGQDVFTYADIAEGFQKTESAVRECFSTHGNMWKHGETFVSEILTGNASRSVRLFTRRGAMRFAFYMTGERAQQFHDHLLDLDESVKSGQLSPTVAQSSDARTADTRIAELAEMAGITYKRTEAAIAEVRQIAEAAAAAVANAPTVNTEAIAEEAANTVKAQIRAESETQKLMRGELDKLVKQYGSDAEMAGYGPAGELCARVNRYLKAKYARDKVRVDWNAEELRPSIAHVKMLIRSLSRPNRLDIDDDDDGQIIDFPTA